MNALPRGATVALTREIPSLTSVVLGVDFLAGAEPRLAENLVMAALLCGTEDRVLSDDHFVFFNQVASPEESVHEREERLGSDAEQIQVELAAVPAEVAKIVLVLYLNEPTAPNRALNQLHTCIIRVLDGANGHELVRSENLAAAFSTETAVVLGELYRYQGEWKFRVRGAGYTNGVRGIAGDYGVGL